MAWKVMAFSLPTDKTDVARLEMAILGYLGPHGDTNSVSQRDTFSENP
jgi:hypothetical protein